MAVKLANPPGTKPKDMIFRLSPSQLSVFKDDPRIFWTYHRAGLRQPYGIKSAMPDEIDDLIKRRFDAHRGAGTLPRELASLAARGIKLSPDFELLGRIRNWRSAPTWLDPETNCTMSGELDDILIFPDGKVASLDIKTTKKRDDFLGYANRYAQTQQAWYAILLGEISKFGVHDHAFLPYYFPLLDPKDTSPDKGLDFGCELVEMRLDFDAAKKVFRDAIKCLRGDLPEATPITRDNKDKDWNGWALEYAAVVAGEIAAKKKPKGAVAAGVARPGPDL